MALTRTPDPMWPTRWCPDPTWPTRRGPDPNQPTRQAIFFWKLADVDPVGRLTWTLSVGRQCQCSVYSHWQRQGTVSDHPHPVSVCATCSKIRRWQSTATCPIPCSPSDSGRDWLFSGHKSGAMKCISAIVSQVQCASAISSWKTNMSLVMLQRATISCFDSTLITAVGTVNYSA